MKTVEGFQLMELSMGRMIFGDFILVINQQKGFIAEFVGFGRVFQGLIILFQSFSQTNVYPKETLCFYFYDYNTQLFTSFGIYSDSKRIQLINIAFSIKSSQQILFHMELTSPKLYDWQAFEHIAPYLNIGQLIKTSTLSKEYNYTLRNYFRKHLLPKESLQGAQNELASIKKIFHRQIQIFRLSDNHRSTIVPNFILKSIQAGNSYALIETYQEKRFMIQISQLVNQAFDIKTFVELDKKYNGKFTNLIGDHIYAVIDTKLIKIAITEGGQIKEDQEIDFESQIIAIKQSQTHLFAVTKNTFHDNKLFAVHLKQFKKNQILYKENLNQTKHLEIENLSVAANAAYYIEKSKVYELDIQNTKQPKLLKNLKDKQISRILNGAKHFFAIQKGRKLTEEWDTKDLVQWANQEGYEDYIKIFKSEKVTGKTLLTIDKKYMEDVLGIVNVKIQQRIMVQLQQANVESEQNSIIYGWGRNDKSQLGTNPSNPVSNPHKIALPEGFKLLMCYNNITLIHNKKTGVISMSSAFEGKVNWQVIFTNVFNIWDINASRDYITLLCPVEKDRISQNMSQTPVHQKKQKLRTAKNIIDKIEWDENVDKKEFRVGYLDKFTGILEISFQQLHASSEIKEYRIEYFKRNGEIVWCKKDRIDIL